MIAGYLYLLRLHLLGCPDVWSAGGPVRWDAVGPWCNSQFALSVVSCVHEHVLLASKLQFRFWPLVTENKNQNFYIQLQLCSIFPQKNCDGHMIIVSKISFRAHLGNIP